MNTVNTYRIGILGGSFDPVHNGHIAVAKAAIRILSLKQLIILPAATSPFKQQPKVDDTHRLKMLNIAFQDVDNVLIDRRELDRPAPSYTVDTLVELYAEHPDKRLFLILGEDTWLGFEKWHQWQRILELAEIAVVNRDNLTPSQLKKTDKFHPIIIPAEAASSTEIRHRIHAGEDLSKFLPTGLILYIKDQKLYV